MVQLLIHVHYYNLLAKDPQLQARDPQLLGKVPQLQDGVPQLLAGVHQLLAVVPEPILTTLALFDHVCLFLRAMDLTLIVYVTVNSIKIKFRFHIINE